jgi:hypothetical protein
MLFFRYTLTSSKIYKGDSIMNSITWLHLSDLHYCEPQSGWDADDILEKLRDDLQHMEKEYGLMPDMI